MIKSRFVVEKLYTVIRNKKCNNDLALVITVIANSLA